MRPLNGEKTHTRTQYALGVLEEIRDNPVPRQNINPSVSNRLLRELLVQEVMIPSPFKTHAGRKIAHLAITDAGVEKLNAR